MKILLDSRDTTLVVNSKNIKCCWCNSLRVSLKEGFIHLPYDEIDAIYRIKWHNKLVRIYTTAEYDEYWDKDFTYECPNKIYKMNGFKKKEKK